MKWNVCRMSWASAALWGMLGAGFATGQEVPTLPARPEAARVQAAETTQVIEVQVQAEAGAGGDNQPLRVRLVVPPGGTPQLVPLAAPQALPNNARDVRIIRLTPSGAQSEQVELQAIATTLGDYWLGVQLGELTDLVKSHLSLEHGLVVNGILPDSPATKAELKVHDIILAVNDKPTKEPLDLIEAVNTAKETELTLSILRAGQKTTVKATPAKRPEAPAAVVGQAVVAADVETHWSKVHDALKHLQVAPGHPPVQLWAFGQPMAVPPGVGGGHIPFNLTAAKLPANCTLQIHKEGSGPAKITVKMGEKTFETTEDKLESLPEEIRGPVLAVLGKSYPHALQFIPTPPVAPQPGPQGGAAIYVPGPAAPPVLTWSAPHSNELSRKLDAVLERLEKLQSEVEKLKK